MESFYENGIKDWGRPDVFERARNNMASQPPLGHRAYTIPYVGTSGGSNDNGFYVEFRAQLTDGLLQGKDIAEGTWTATSPSGVDVPVQTVGDNVLRGRLMNPTEPGLYEIRFESKAGAYAADDTDYFAVSQVLIPSAGADVTSFLYNELLYVLDDYHDHDASNVPWDQHDPVPADTSPGWTAHWTDLNPFGRQWNTFHDSLRPLHPQKNAKCGTGWYWYFF